MSWTVPIIENDILAGVLGISFDIDENTINDIIQTKTNCQGDEPAYL